MTDQTMRGGPSSPGSADKRNPQESLLRLQTDFLREVRAASTGNLSARLAAAGFNDVPPDGLLLLAAIWVNGTAARELIRGVGITVPAASQLLEALITCGYLEFCDNPDSRRQPTVAITERGRAMIAEAEAGLRAERWAGFPFRPGDIVISTAPRSGTTWTQMICALLIFQTPDLPAPLPRVSPWLDFGLNRDEAYAELAAQQHRRFIKTHVPLNDIPADPRVTYLVVARHPLDTAVSHQHLTSVSLSGNSSAQSDAAERSREPQRQWMLDQIGHMGTSPHGRDSYLDELLKRLSAAWTRRSEPNVVLLHYEDLSTDLAGEMRRLAARLGITVPAARWPGLVRAATFEQMRAAADRLQPARNRQDQEVPQDQATFFWQGTSGNGRALLAEAELARYHARAEEVAGPDMLEWLHRDRKSVN